MGCNIMLDEFLTIFESRKAVQQLSSGKGPGAAAISANVYKAVGLPMAEKVQHTLNRTVSPLCGERRLSHKYLRMRPQSVTITEASPS